MGPPGRNLDNTTPLFNFFFVVKHQATGVMHKNGELHTTCSPRLKVTDIWQKTFFVNFTRFSTKYGNGAHFAVGVLFLTFLEKCVLFSGGGSYRSKLNFPKL